MEISTNPLYVCNVKMTQRSIHYAFNKWSPRFSRLPTISIGGHLTATKFLEILILPIALSLLESKAYLGRNLYC